MLFAFVEGLLVLFLLAFGFDPFAFYGMFTVVWWTLAATCPLFLGQSIRLIARARRGLRQF